jgi:hypothetical protein
MVRISIKKLSIIKKEINNSASKKIFIFFISTNTNKFFLLNLKKNLNFYRIFI